MIINYDQVAEDGERFTAERKKEALKQAILGCPELTSVGIFETQYVQRNKRAMDYKEYRSMVIDMCGSLDIAREASSSGHSKRLSQAHESDASEHATNVHEADENRDDEDGQDTQDLLEILVNRLSRKKLSGPRPDSKSLRATVLSSCLKCSKQPNSFLFNATHSC